MLKIRKVYHVTLKVFNKNQTFEKLLSQLVEQIPTKLVPLDKPRTVIKYIRVFVFWTARNISKLLRILITFLKTICNDKTTDVVLKHKISGNHVMLSSFPLFLAQCSACFLFLDLLG